MSLWSKIETYPFPNWLQLKLQNDDYKGMDPEKAMSDFMERVNAYERVYQVRKLYA